MAAPLPMARANESGAGAGAGAGATDQASAAGAAMRRVVTALLFLAAVALPCLVLYRAVAPAGVLVRPAAVPWQAVATTAAQHDDVDLVSKAR